MDIKSLLEEYRQVQRTRSIQRLAKKTTAALIQFKNVRFQQGSDPSKEDITINIRQGIFPDLGVIVFRNKTSIIFTLEGSFGFNDRLESDAELKIDFEEGEDKDISLVFPNKNQKEEFVGVITHYLSLSNCSSPDPENPPSNS